MVSLKSILIEVNSLSPVERTELLARLLEQIAQEAEADDAAVGERGLVAWTESTRGESWQEFYPEDLQPRPGDNS